MISLFSIAPNDASVGYLTQLFGNMGGIIPPNGGAGGEFTLISTMFKVFNGVLLTVGALIVVYVTVVGVMITAHEGEFMGKKYHQIWTPVRIVLGILALVPLPSGYSVIQMVMMWVIVQGIGAADVLWDTALKYISQMGSPYAQISVQTSGPANAFSDLFQGLACSASAVHPNPDKLTPKYFCESNNCAGFSDSFTDVKTSYPIGPGGLCGTLLMCDQDALCTSTGGTGATGGATGGVAAGGESLPCQICKAQHKFVSEHADVLISLAQQYVDADYGYRSFYALSAWSDWKDEWNWIKDYCNNRGVQQCCVPPPISALLNFANLAKKPKCKGALPDASFYPANNPDDFGSPTAEAVSNIYWPYYVVGKIPSGSGDFLRIMMDDYATQISPVLRAYVSQLAGTGAINDPRLQAASNTGWIFAGGYYYLIAQMNNANLLNVPTIKYIFPITQGMNGYRNNRSGAGVLLDMAAGIPPSQGPTAKISAQIFRHGQDLDSALTTLGKSRSNPISQLQVTGMSMLMAVQYAFLALLAVSFTVALVGFISAFYLGTGFINPIGPASTVAGLYIIPAVLFFFGVLITFGGLLGVYVPLIPYIIFTFGAIGWMISAIEAMVAGPLVALGILSPSAQHHEILGRSEPALMLLFSIFLRPSLMIFGLMAGMLLSTAVVEMINAAFWSTVAAGIAGAGGEWTQTIATGGQNAANTVGAGLGVNVSGTGGVQVTGISLFATNPLEGVIFVGAYVALIVVAINKCFATIYMVPDNVMRWIHAESAQRGGEEGLTEIRQGVSQAAAGGDTAMRGVAKGLKDYGEKKKKEKGGEEEIGGEK